jgi:hypothetical protein
MDSRHICTWLAHDARVLCMGDRPSSVVLFVPLIAFEFNNSCTRASSTRPLTRSLRRSCFSARTQVLMWAGISVQPSGFIFGAALLGMGLSLGETAAALMIGNLLLLGPLVLNALPGAKYVRVQASKACAFLFSFFSRRTST